MPARLQHKRAIGDQREMDRRMRQSIHSHDRRRRASPQPRDHAGEPAVLASRRRGAVPSPSFPASVRPPFAPARCQSPNAITDASPLSSAALAISSSATAAMLASASPRKPSVRTPVEIVERPHLAGGMRLARRASKSSAAMPTPSSATRSSRSPPSRSSTRTLVAPASRAFSISSRTTEAGRSMISPAAMRSITSGGKSAMRRAALGAS